MENYTKRVSIRDFDGKTISEKDIKVLQEIINNSPTSTNSQQFSAIIITDKQKMEFISKKNYGQKHIAEASGLVLFLADRTRMLYSVSDMEMTKSMLGNEFMRSATDAVIACTYAQTALVEMGYGTVHIGGLPSFGEELSKVLKVPETAFFVAGLAFGKATKTNDFKPKMNKVFVNEYNIDKNTKELVEYDKTLKDYYEKRDLKGDYFETMRSMSDKKGGYAKPFSAGGDYFNKARKNFK